MPYTPPIQKPQINLNGTSREELISQYSKAADALREAASALAGAAPHGRDYQTLPDGAYNRARSQHRDHLNALDEAHRYVEAILTDLVQA